MKDISFLFGTMSPIVCNCKDGAVLYRIDSTDDDAYTALIGKAGENGFGTTASNSIGGSIFTTLMLDDTTLYASYSGNEKVIRVIAKENAGSVEGLGFDGETKYDVLLTQLSQPYYAPDCGMSYLVRLADGRFVCELAGENGAVDAFGHKTTSGSAAYLCSLVTGKLGIKSRAVEMSTLQRAGTHLASLTDINEAFQVGADAVKAANEGKTGMMVVLKRNGDDPYQCGTDIYDIHEIANVERKIPDEWITPDGCNLTDDFVRYARPLIMGELAPIFVDGLPRHLKRK